MKTIHSVMPIADYRSEIDAAIAAYDKAKEIAAFGFVPSISYDTSRRAFVLRQEHVLPDSYSWLKSMPQFVAVDALESVPAQLVEHMMLSVDEQHQRVYEPSPILLALSSIVKEL